MSVAAEQLSHEELVREFYKQQNTFEAERSSLLERNAAQQEKIEKLQVENAWYRKQFFGQKTERILRARDSTNQLSLGEGYEPGESPPAPTTPVKSYERSHRRDEVEFSEDESLLKFEESVPQEEKRVPNPAVEGLSPDEYEVIGDEVAYKLAQRPGPYVVIKYVRPKVKLKASGEISTAPVPSACSVIERSVAEVSFLVGLLLDKFQYHLPLYRQHQRLTASGIHLNRMTLTNLVHRTAQLLEPIYVSLQSSVLLSRVLALDE